MQWVRRLTGRGDSKARTLELDPLTLSAFMLVEYMSLTAGACADAVLDEWPALADGKTAGPAVSYSVHSQFLFLYLHTMDRMAFADGGDECRVAVRDVVRPQLIPTLNAYLSGRHKPAARVSSSELIPEVSDAFFEMLDRSELSFSRLPDYRSMMTEVAERLTEAWELKPAEALAEIVRREAGTRGHNLKPLLSEVIRQLDAV